MLVRRPSPAWLERLLSTTFFTVCKAHMKAPRNQCNMYCLDCSSSCSREEEEEEDHALCFYCRQSWHKNHQVIQIRRSSYHDVVKVAKIQKALDISRVQTYVINTARVLFLNERPRHQHLKNNNSDTITSHSHGGNKTNSHFCEICPRNFLDRFRFCSLGCKLVGVKKNGNASFVLSAKKLEREMQEGMGRRLVSREEELREEGKMQKQVYQSTSSLIE